MEPVHAIFNSAIKSNLFNISAQDNYWLIKLKDTITTSKRRKILVEFIIRKVPLLIVNVLQKEPNKIRVIMYRETYIK